MGITSLFSRETEPKRKIFLSDTLGGPIDPLERADADAWICTHFGSQPFDPLDLKVDTFGQERGTDHLLRLTSEWHDRIDRCTWLSKREKKRFRDDGTAVLINAAPRIENNATNGTDFVVAQLRNNIRVVATPLHALSPVKHDVERLRRMPNANNGLWSDTEQFRSALAGILMSEKFARRFPLQEIDPAVIPDPSDGPELAHVDRFGNLITHSRDPHLLLQQLQTLQQWSGGFRLKIGDVVREDLLLRESLSSSEPGRIVVYGNGNVDLVRKWTPLDRTEAKLALSAYRRFGNPVVGSPISFGERNQRFFAFDAFDDADAKAA